MSVKLSRYQTLEDFDRAREAREEAEAKEVRIKSLAMRLVIRNGTLNNIRDVLNEPDISDEEIQRIREIFERIMG